MKSKIWVLLKKLFGLSKEDQNNPIASNEDRQKISKVIELSVSWRNHSIAESDEYCALIRQGYERKAAVQVAERLRKGLSSGIDLLFYKENYDMSEFDRIRYQIPRVSLQY